MFKSSRAIVALCLSGLLLGFASVPASAAAVGAAPQLVQPAAVSVPYGSGPIVIDPLATAVTLPGQDILPGNNFNGVFDFNNAVTAYGHGETDASALAPAFVKNLEQPGDFVGQINLIDAGADIYALHQKNRLVVIVLPYEGFSGNLKLAYAGEIVQGVQPVYTFNNVPISVTVQDPPVQAVDDSVTGPLFAGGGISSSNGLSATGGSLTIPDILVNDASTFPGRSTSVFFGSKASPQTIIAVPEGVVNMDPNGNGVTFYSYDKDFTGKVTVPYTVCSSYTINPRTILDLWVNNSSTSEVCSTALLTFDIPSPVVTVPTLPETPVVPTLPETPVVPTLPETPVVPTLPETPVVPMLPETPAPVVPVPVAASASAPIAEPVSAAHAQLHIADGSAAAPVVAVSPGLPYPAVFGIAALVMVIFAGGLIAVGRMRRK